MIKSFEAFKKKFIEFWDCYSYFKSINGTFEVYFKSWIFPKGKKRCSISYDSIQALYAGNSEFSFFDIIIFLKNKKWLWIEKTIWKEDSLRIRNWEEMVNILSLKLPNFNKHNLLQAEKVMEEFPVPCWDSKKEIPDIQVVWTKKDQKIIWKDTGEEYLAEEFFRMMNESERIRY